MTGQGHGHHRGTGRFADAIRRVRRDDAGILHFTAPMELTFSWDGEISY
jgi:hypothetical protein